MLERRFPCVSHVLNEDGSGIMCVVVGGIRRARRSPFVDASPLMLEVLWSQTHQNGVGPFVAGKTERRNVILCDGGCETQHNEHATERRVAVQAV